MNESISKTIDRKILLNPGPATTTEGVKQAQIVPDICPREEEFGTIMSYVRKMATKVVHGEGSHTSILLPGSGTGAIESCLSSCVDQGQEILILNNGAYGERMEKICQAFDIKYNSLCYEWGDAINLDEVNSHLEQNKERYSVVAFVHHETTVGILNPLEELLKLKKLHNVRFIVDAMSSYAGLPINVVDSDIDYLISSSNKCIQGMAGVGIVIAKKSSLEEIKNYKVKNFYFNLYNNYAGQENKGQFLFTPPVQTMYALAKAFEEYEKEGEQGRFERYSSLYRQMLDGMKEMGFACLVPESQHSRILTAFIDPDHPNYDFEKMHDYLYMQGVTIYPGKNAKKDTFRISNIGQLNKEDIELYLKLVRSYLSEAGIDKIYSK